MMPPVPPITYCLSTEDDRFYADLAQFTDTFLATLQAPVEEEIILFREFITRTQQEETRSLHEYLIEFLAAGLFFRIYAGQARRSSGLLISLLTRLFSLRKRFPGMKPSIDAMRGLFISRLLHDEATPLAPCSREAFTRLLRWLEATGDFREEVERLRLWQAYLSTLPENRVARLLSRASMFADSFREQAGQALGQYTSHVESFLRHSHPAYTQREDYIFCGRHEVEYHLNMVGAEILNRALRANFTRARQKAVLLPTCMCAPGGGACRARHHDLEITCTSCTASCPVNVINKRLAQEGVATFLIPHSSSFTQFLEQWQDHHVGLVGVACVLNLLTGGYEMMKLGIAAQCVFLDYCGCRKHWHAEGLPTNVNARQLLHIVSAASAPEEQPPV